MRKAYLVFLGIISIAVLWYGYSEIAILRSDAIADTVEDPDNLLENSGFESEDMDLAEGWSPEYTVKNAPLYNVVPDKRFGGSLVQKIEYRGSSEDKGEGFIEIFQLVEGVRPGDKLKFSIYIGGTLSDAPAVIGMEGFNSSHEYIYLSESDLYLKDVSRIPKLYEVVYTCPEDTDCVAVYLQCQEVVPSSRIKIAIDNGRLVRLPPGYVEAAENDLEERMIWIISSILLAVPSVIILSEAMIRIKGRRKTYEFSGHKNDNFKILVPIWGSIKYLENVQYLAKYGPRVLLCTTAAGSAEFYEDLRSLADRHGFGIFIDEYGAGEIPARRMETNIGKRATSGSVRDTVIRNALKTVGSTYVVTLDADSITDEDISLLVGEFERRHLDIASIRILPSNGEISFLTKFQRFEYEAAMDFRYLCPWLISGACHIARTYVLADIMSRHSLFFQGNDVETGLLAKTIGYKVGHIPFIVRTAVPEDLSSWTRQRLAWAGGEFRLYIMNMKFIFRHPFFWFYGAVITIGFFPLRWKALAGSTPSLYIILALYILLTLCIHWKNKNRWLFLMPFYTLFISVVMPPLGVIWYFYMAYKDKNYGIIDAKNKLKIIGI